MISHANNTHGNTKINTDKWTRTKTNNNKDKWNNKSNENNKSDKWKHFTITLIPTTTNGSTMNNNTNTTPTNTTHESTWKPQQKKTANAITLDKNTNK